MSRRPVYSRPRTKVYQTNYNIGESLYRPALDGLDRKYGGRSFGDFGGYGYGGPSANGDVFGMRGPPPPMDMPPARSSSFMRERERDEDEFFGDMPRRRPNSALLGEFDAIFEGRMRNGIAKERTPMRGGRTFDDEIEDDISSSMKRLRAVKASRAFADEIEDMESSFRKDVRSKPRLEFSDKLMDSVGLTKGARANLEEEGSTIGRRRFLRMTSDPEGEEMTKWTALRPGRRQIMQEEEETTVTTTGGAAARALKSRARLEDLESEMQALSEKSAAREKRVRDLKALVQENESSAMDNLQSTVRMKSSIQSEKKSIAY